MYIRKRSVADAAGIKPSEITPERVYHERRLLLQAATSAGLLAASGLRTANAANEAPKLGAKRNDKLSTTSEKVTSFEDITSYNNYYEFGTDKSDPAARSGNFKPMPWSVKVSGEAEVTGTFALEDLLKPHAVEERVYRMRCVEAWSMVIPWAGIPLGDVLKRFKPTSNAKYVAFKTVYRPREMPGQSRDVLRWPYVEGLRIDEAMNPLTLLAVGLYDQRLPNQNGAPLRLVTPWKYGFKGIKSIVEITFTDRQPPTAWNIAAPNEYGFYANVNPQVDHPRWSQASERRIGAGLFSARQPTLMFNGYGEYVAQMYQGMNLAKYF